MAAIDWIIIALYLGITLLIGVLLTKRASSSTDEYFISGRNLPWWLAGTSMVATSFSSDTPLVITGWVRSEGVSANWIWWCFAIGGMFSVFLLSRLWRRAEVVTDVELTELRYSGPSAALLRGFRAAYFAIPVNCITIAWVIVGMMKLTRVIFGIAPEWAVGVCVAVTTIYCVASGYWGVVVTDFIQFIVAMGGAILLCVLSVRSVGGLAGLAAQFRKGTLDARLLDLFPRPPEGAGLFDAEFWSGPICAFLAFVAVQWWANKNADGGGAVIQRMASCKSERDSLLATLWFNVATYALRSWPWILVALASLILFPELKDHEMGYPAMIERLAPPGVLGLMIASFLAAFMSTIDTHLNLSASYVVNDVYRRFIRKHASERHYVLISRLVSIVFVILSSLIALKADSISALFKFLLAFSSGVGLVYILRWFWWRINAWSEISAMVASSLICSGLYVYNGHVERAKALGHSAILLFTVVGSTLVWLLVTYLTAPVSEERLVAFYRKVRPYGAWRWVAKKAGVPPPMGLSRHLLDWMAGTVMVLGATFALGKFLLGEPMAGLLWSLAAAVGGLIVWRNPLQSSAETPRHTSAR